MRERSAVLIIDVQAGLFAGDRPVYDGEAVVNRIHALADRARLSGVPVIYIQDDDVGPLNSPEWQIHPSLTVQEEDVVLRKAYVDSFYQTALEEELSSREIGRLVVAGCKTDACIEMTCRRAVSLGYDVTLVSDAHSTSDNRFMTAPESIAYYNIILDGFGAEDGFGNGQHEVVVQPTSEIEF